MRGRLFILLLLGITQFANAQATCNHTDSRFNCVKYLGNYDGDTITFEIPNIHPLFGEHIPVRVKGIDTAEIRTKNLCEKQAGRTAQRLVENLLKGAKRVDLVHVARDKYFRILADVEIDGKNLKDVLVKNKLAYFYDGGTKKKVDWCDPERVPSSQGN